MNRISEAVGYHGGHDPHFLAVEQIAIVKSRVGIVFGHDAGTARLRFAPNFLLFGI